MGRITHLLNATCIVERKVRHPNGTGGFVETFEPIQRLKCRCQSAGYRDVVIAQQTQAAVTHVFYVEPVPASDIKVNDQLLANGRRYRVVVPNQTPSVNDVYQKVLAEEIQR